MGQAGGAAHIMASLVGDTMEVVWYGAKTHETLKRGPFDFAASSSGQAVRLTSAQLYVFGTNLECGVGQEKILSSPKDLTRYLPTQDRFSKMSRRISGFGTDGSSCFRKSKINPDF